MQCEETVPTKLPLLQTQAKCSRVPRATLISDHLGTNLGLPTTTIRLNNLLERCRTHWKLLYSWLCLLPGKDTLKSAKRRVAYAYGRIWEGSTHEVLTVLSPWSPGWCYLVLALMCATAEYCQPGMLTQALVPSVIWAFITWCNHCLCDELRSPAPWRLSCFQLTQTLSLPSLGLSGIASLHPESFL